MSPPLGEERKVKGAVVHLTPSSSGWAASLVYSFEGLADGATPDAAVTFDSAGNLYGTVTQSASFGMGGVFRLSPSGGGMWTESVLLSFEETDGATPWASVTLDGQGNIYGTAAFGGSSGDGVSIRNNPVMQHHLHTTLFNDEGSPAVCLASEPEERPLKHRGHEGSLSDRRSKWQGSVHGSGRANLKTPPI